MNQTDAQKKAIECLYFLASNEDYLGDFLSITGLGPGTIRQAAQDPNFLNAVITFIMDDEKRILDCATALNISPEKLLQIYEVLVGSPYSDLD